jgi:hypothetical protein
MDAKALKKGEMNPPSPQRLWRDKEGQAQFAQPVCSNRSKRLKAGLPRRSPESFRGKGRPVLHSRFGDGGSNPIKVNQGESR